MCWREASGPRWHLEGCSSTSPSQHRQFLEAGDLAQELLGEALRVDFRFRAFVRVGKGHDDQGRAARCRGRFLNQRLRDPLRDTPPAETCDSGGEADPERVWTLGWQDDRRLGQRSGASRRRRGGRLTLTALVAAGERRSKCRIPLSSLQRTIHMISRANLSTTLCNQLLLYKLVSGAEPLVTIAAMAPGSRPSDTIVAIVTRILTGATLRPIRVSLSDYQEVRSGERSLVLNHSELHCSTRTRTIGIVGQDARVLVVDDVVVSVLGRLAYGEEPVR